MIFFEWAIFLISFVGLAYEIELMRIFSMAQWHHFAYMMISIAMLGFGASGTLLSLFRKQIQNREKTLFRISAFLLMLSVVGCTYLSQLIPFETFQLVTQNKQIGYLILLYLTLAVPFFLVSTCITLGFFLAPWQVGRIYFFSMVGSGLGAASVVGLFYFFSPSEIPTLLAIPAAIAFLLVSRGQPGKLFKALVLVCLFGLFAPIYSQMPIRISEYKGLSYALQYPDAKVLATERSPLSVITAVSSSMIRVTPGEISHAPKQKQGLLPKQVGLFFDGGSQSVVNQFDGDFKPFSYLDNVTSALPYHLLDKPNVLVIGAGGGTDVLSALYHKANEVTAVEVDPKVFPLIQKQFGDFSGHLYERADVLPVLAEGRGYLQSTNKQYDLIQIALLDSFTASASGVHALNENYLYTLEAVELYLNRLTPNGVLSITRWVKAPARDLVKMFATLVEACEKWGIQNPAQHLAFIRSWNTGTLLVSRSPISHDQIEKIREFAKSRQFDLSYLPGIRKEELNRYTLLDEPVYYDAAMALLSSERELFYRNTLFYVRPATDESPYFFRFFKWQSLPRLIRGMGTEWMPFVEWGMLTLLATLVQAALVSVVLILLPLIVFARKSTVKRVKRWVVAYFAGLGLAYMFLEIAFIQKCMLFLAYPIYAVAVVLTAFLIFSGWGSFFADLYQGNKARLVGGAVLAIAVLTFLYIFFLPNLFNLFSDQSDLEKIGISLVFLAPLAFFMGIPFPSGLQLISNKHEPLIPWAWGINGCASVMGALLATFIAVTFGFTLLVLLAVLIYILSSFVLKKI